MDERRYIHDCQKCIFLGQFNEFDLYFCGGTAYNTVIARYGDDGPDYLSGMFSIDPNLEEAKKRARELGLLK